MSSAFLSIGIIIAGAAALGAIARSFRQPLVLAYILVGVIGATLGLFQDQELHTTLSFLAELGIAFLLFLVGLELKFDEVKYLGKIAFYTGLGEVAFTGIIGFILSRFLGFGNVAALYISLALALSSTVIVIKLLTEKRDLDSLYGKIAVGLLLVQDLVAIGALVLIASFGGGDFTFFKLLLTGAEGAIFVVLTFFLSRSVAPAIFDKIAKNTELLFLLSIAWVMVFASIFALAGYSIEIGAFLAGVGLSSLKEEHQIASRIRPLRDLFVAIFFITLGLQISLGGIAANIFPALILSAFVLIGNPIAVMAIMGRLGFRIRTSFLVGVSVAQISEFSLVLVALGLRVGHIEGQVVNLVALVGIITITASSYLILNATKIYKREAKYLGVFEKRGVLEEKTLEERVGFADHFVLVGVGRLGREIFDFLKGKGKRVVAVDFNPAVVRKLTDEGERVLFGDINDEEIFEKVNLPSAKLVISTMFDPVDTEDFLGHLSEKGIRTPIVVTSADTRSALKLYNLGADYVIIPRILSSYIVAHILSDSHIEELFSGELKKKHLEEIKAIDNILSG